MSLPIEAAHAFELAAVAGGARVHLYTRDVAITPDSRRGDFPEPDAASGYAPLDVPGDDWQVAAGELSCSERGWRFTGAAGPIWGYFVTQARTDKLLWAQRGEDVPWQLRRRGDQVLVTPRFYLRGSNA